MKKVPKTYIDVEIDKLTNSIENVVSGDIFDAEVVQLKAKDAKQIKKTEWLFDWGKQLQLTDWEIYKLIIPNNPNIIQGFDKFEW